MAKIFPYSVAFASLSLSQELCITLLRKGLLSHDELDEVFAKGIEAQTSMGSPVNDGAAGLLSEIHEAVEWEWPRGALEGKTR